MFLEDFDYDSESEFRKSKHAMSKYSKQINGMQLPASLSCCVFFNMTVLSSVVTRTIQLILKAFLFFFPTRYHLYLSMSHLSRQKKLFLFSKLLFLNMLSFTCSTNVCFNFHYIQLLMLIASHEFSLVTLRNAHKFIKQTLFDFASV